MKSRRPRKRYRKQRLAEGPLYQEMDEVYERFKNTENWLSKLEQVVIKWNEEHGTRKDPKKEISNYLHARANYDYR